MGINPCIWVIMMLLSYLLNRVEDEDFKEDLVGGLVGGLAVGLAVSLVFGLVFGLAEIYNSSIELFIFLLIMILVVSEILFWCDKHKYEDMNRWDNALLKKGESLFESSIVIVNVVYLLNHYQDIFVFFGKQQDNIKTVLGFVGIGTVVVLLVLGWLWLNSLKYREKKEKEKDKDKGKK